MFKTKIILGEPKEGFSKDYFSYAFSYIDEIRFKLNRYVFEKLVKTDKIRGLLVILFSLGLIFMIFSLLLEFANNERGYQNMLNWAYMFFTIPVLIVVSYFLDIYVANRLLYALQLASRYERYHGKAGGYKKNFEWNTTTLAIVGGLKNNGPRDISYQDFAESTGIKRPSAVSLLNKMEERGIIKRDNKGYAFSEVRIEVWKQDKKKGIIVKDVNLTKQLRERLQYLFDLLCFDAQLLYGAPNTLRSSTK